VARTDKSRVPALAYLRTSSAANVGDGKDSDKRQRDAIQSFAKHAGYRQRGLEGIVSKRMHAPYKSGNRDWIKV
jgi:ATP-dependent DNA ligase